MHQTVSSSRGLGSSRASVLECRRQGCCAGPTATHQPARHLATAHAPRWGQLSRACAQAVSQQPAAAAAADSHSQASTSGRQPDFTHEQQQASRRGVLLTVGALVSSLAAPGQLHPAQAAGAEGGSCQLQQSATGLQWCDLTVGEGQKPIKSAFTKVNYTAKLASTGAVFDSTYQRKQPLIFKAGECEMVQAFDVAVLGAEDMPAMREGGKRLVVAPPGPMQRQGVKSLTWVTGLLEAIDEAGEPRTPEGGFNSVLVFEIELMPKRRG